MNFKRFFSLQRFRKSLPPEEVEEESSESVEKKTETGMHLEPDLKIVWQRILGFGNFSVVYMGSLKKIINPVAVKIPRQKNNEEWTTLNKRILEEIAVMREIGDHENILQILGVHQIDTLMGAICVITPLCMNGSLQTYLRAKPIDVVVIRDEQDLAECITRKETTSFLTLHELLKFCYEIAHGMNFITSKGIIHGDLSSRNVLLDINKTCKISDFGLSKRNTAEEDNERGEKIPDADDEPRFLPWRWMAIECLEGGPISVSSDVWSFGVTVWEILTIGDMPFPRQSLNEQFKNDLRSGDLCLQKPNHATLEMYAKMQRCWNCDKSQRPCFESLQKFYCSLMAATEANLNSSSLVLKQIAREEPAVLHSLVTRRGSGTTDSPRMSVRRASNRHRSLIFPDKDNNPPDYRGLTNTKFKFNKPLGKLESDRTNPHQFFKEIMDGKFVVVKKYQEASSRTLDDIKIMQRIGSHQNLVKFIGIFYGDVQPSGKKTVNVIVEYCENGNLQDHLRANFNSNEISLNDDSVFYTLCKFALEIARGMEFIASKKVIHADLSTIMVLLDTHLTCKVRSSSLSRRMNDFSDNIYTKKIAEPLQWRTLSIETLKRLEFSPKSDVWSYGIVLWEIFSLGQIPYEGLYCSPSFEEKLINGYRLPKPENCSLDIYTTMMTCWDKNPANRPTFTKLSEFFEKGIGVEYLYCAAK